MAWPHSYRWRPLGQERFLIRLEQALGRELRPRKRGPEDPRKHTRSRRTAKKE